MSDFFMDPLTPFLNNVANAMTAMCRRLARDEVERGFERCLLNYSSEAMQVVANFESWPASQRLAVALAFTTLPQDRTTEEKLLVDSFRQRLGASFLQPQGNLLNATSLARMVDSPLARQAGTMAAKEVMRLFTAEFRTIYGRSLERVGDTIHQFQSDLGNQWTLKTTLDFGGNF